MKPLKKALVLASATFGLAATAHAYDGTNCKAPGNCWEPKPNYPAKIAGSKYDPKHDPAEINKNEEAVKAMEERNAKRLAAARKTGKFQYDLDEQQ